MRRTFVTAVSCIALLLGQRGTACAAESFKYLVQAANEITTIDHSALTLSDEQKGQIAKIGCEALTRLVNDPDFNDAINGLLSSKERLENQTKAYDLLVDAHEFNEVFLRTEGKALQAAGLDFPTTIESLARVSARRDVETLKETTAPRVLEATLQAQKAVCALETRLVTQDQAAHVMWAILGVVIIVANVAATAATIGLTAPMAFASTASGLSG